MDIKLEPGWKALLTSEFQKDYFLKLIDFVRNEYRTATCYPPGTLIFSAFNHCPLDKLKVVILGQDPYHGPGQANGLCFSVSDHIAQPPSLKNIFKEINSDLDKAIPQSGNLERWADQGVLLLNATLTVRAGQAASHQDRGWEVFTDEVIRLVNDLKQGVVFMLWGNYAQKKGAFIDTSRHLVLKSAHPSPLAGGAFFGQHHFSKANDYLKSLNLPEIDW
ncbi:MAG: uracil-DNA glycosylase [Flavobacteriales bacterium]|nr:uracil-DNA glycosylase [Flavobacteriales bacterium]